MANVQVRIAGVDIPVKKRIDAALPYVYGVGRPLALKILKLARVDGSKRTYDLSQDEISRIRAVVESDKFMVEGNLRQKVFNDIKRLRDIRCYRGIRHKIGLPVRGQRTRHNAHTRKGRHIAVGGLRKKVEKT